jgi:hypothetical protein
MKNDHKPRVANPIKGAPDQRVTHTGAAAKRRERRERNGEFAVSARQEPHSDHPNFSVETPDGASWPVGPDGVYSRYMRWLWPPSPYGIRSR